jgi:hypothetical protein
MKKEKLKKREEHREVTMPTFKRQSGKRKKDKMQTVGCDFREKLFTSQMRLIK